MGDLGVCFVFGGVVVFAIVNAAWRATRSSSLLEQWARENGFTILEQEKRHLFRGSYFWTTSKGQVVYWIVVLDRQGRRRSGYVRLGSRFGGLLPDKVDVRWD